MDRERSLNNVGGAVMSAAASYDGDESDAVVPAHVDNDGGGEEGDRPGGDGDPGDLVTGHTREHGQHLHTQHPSWPQRTRDNILIRSSAGLADINL